MGKNATLRNRARSAEWRKNNPTQVRAQQLWHKFKLTVNQYEDMCKTQNNVCAICGNTNKSGRQLAVDHCHDTGKIRGLLCAACNSGLGHFKDDLQMLIKAQEYLKKYG